MAIDYAGSFLGDEIISILEKSEDLFDVTSKEEIVASINKINSITQTQIDEGFRPYKVYTALLTQTGTNAPVATVIENTLGQTVTPLYQEQGIYALTVPNDQFLSNKLICFISNGIPNSALGAITITRATNKIVRIYLFDAVGNPIDGELNKASIEIRVYP